LHACCVFFAEKSKLHNAPETHHELLTVNC
jgi:hypothetical protein